MATISQGTTLRFTPSGGTAATVGRLSSIGEIAPEAEALDVTTLDAPGGFRQSIQGLKNPGEVEVTGFHDPADGGQAALRAAFFSGGVGRAEVTFPDGDTAAFDCWVKRCAIGSAEVDAAIGFSATLALTGPVTFTGAQEGGE